MVSRTHQQGGANGDERHEVLPQKPSKTVVKETQREGNGSNTPRQTTKEVPVPTKAQDVAELKDYVRNTPFDKISMWYHGLTPC